jgi:hypothetical protein
MAAPSTVLEEFVLPLRLRHPDGKVVWVCNYDEDKKLTSVFQHLAQNAMQDRLIDYIDIDKLREIHTSLAEAGWEPWHPEEIITFEDPNAPEQGRVPDTAGRPANRAERRAAANRRA